MQNMFAWLIKTAQWISVAETDVNTADFRNVSVSAWSKKVKSLLLLVQTFSDRNGLSLKGAMPSFNAEL